MTTVSRLIDYFIPAHYELSLDIERTDRKFDGSVTITGSSPHADQPIKFHARDLTIVGATIDGKVAQFEMGEDDELTLHSEGLGTGEHEVNITFGGEITDGMHGLYPCYFEHNGTKKELLATQFESHHAREVFPCIDEPAAKATFDVHLTTEMDVSVLGNMPVKSQKVDAERLITTFDTTPRMSTYLVAFVTGDLQQKTRKTKTGVDITVWATPAQDSASLDFPLESAVEIVEFFDNYFGTPYPLPKADFVALPDFSSGAMENWGLITFREVALLAHPQTTSISSRRYVASVIAHELSHQWFGNLVTMQWWDDLWLNESFATLMSFIALDHLHPDWNTWLDFTLDETIQALRRDCIDGVQPVKVDVKHPDEINTIFDPSIVYAKGARLMRMVQHYIGEEAFQAGLKQYFSDHAYKNTVGDDLWSALSKASDKNIKDMMNTWLSQTGYPVVTITRDDDTVTLEQQQFFVGPHKSTDTLWPIPLDANSQNAPRIFDTRKISFTSSEPLHLNQRDSAHFITSYDELSRQALIDKIEDNSLDPLGRLQRLNEATLLARGGVISSDKLLPVIKAFHNEPLDSVWSIASITLAELRKFVEDNKETEQKLRRFSAELAREEYERLGWTALDNEPEEDTKLRSTIIAMTLYGEVPEALQKAKELYQTTPLEALDPELRPLIISSVVRYGDGVIVDELLEAYQETASADLLHDICVGITSTRLPEKIALLLECVKNPDIVRQQDVFRWYAYLIRGRDSREMAWRWARDNWDWITETFRGDKSYDDIPRYSASGLMTRQQLQEYKDFFGPKSQDPALARAILMGTSEIEGRVELIERDKTAVQKALLDNS
jgi:aminopeptidase N